MKGRTWWDVYQLKAASDNISSFFGGEGGGALVNNFMESIV